MDYVSESSNTNTVKTYISYLVIALLMTHTLTAQVKIGDNPQNLNNSSVLELESTSRVLVITRVNDLQMNAIFPLRGALVYNTDHDCLHYYTGTEWVNICEELDNSFTVSTRADHMRPINPNALDNTVVITETPNPDGSINYNFEVGIINGANIAPSAVNGDKIQNGTVGSQDLAPRSVGLSHLQDGGAYGDLFQWNGSTWTLINESDINITENQDLADVIAVDPSAGNQQIKDLQNPTDLQDAATMSYVDDSIAASDALDLDKDETNELQDLNLTGNILTLNNPATAGNQVDLVGYLDNTDNQNLSIGGGGAPNQSVEVAISGGTSALVDVRDGDFDPNNEIQNVIAGTGIGVSQVGLDFIVDNTEPDQVVSLTDGGSGNVTIGGAYPSFTIDVADITTGDITSSDLNVSGGTDATLNNVTLEINPGAVGNLELATNAVTTDKIQDGTITNDDIQPGAGIDGSKINPTFVSDVSTTGDFISGGTILTVPDFVFQKYYTGFSNLDNSYRFRSLKEIEAFVKENNHLPGIRSAYEVKASGEYGLTQSSLAHLEKIEELFLHTIEQEKKIEKLQSENKKMAEELNALKSDMEKIKAMLSEKNQD